MKHEYNKYLDEICAAIEEMASKPLTPERARCMHDYLYIKKHFAEYMEHKDIPRMKNEDGSHKSYFGG